LRYLSGTMKPRNSKPRNSKRGRESKVPRLRPRRRGQGDIEPTTPKSYTLPFAALLEIRRLAGEYGSQGRALQVGVELLIRMRKLPAVGAVDSDTLVRMTYKLTPRTIRLIDGLASTHYDNAGQVISACLKALSMKKIN
jgi:hypothetical protein